MVLELAATNRDYGVGGGVFETAGAIVAKEAEDDGADEKSGGDDQNDSC